MGIMGVDNNFQNHAVGYKAIEVLATPNFVTGGRINYLDEVAACPNFSEAVTFTPASSNAGIFQSESG